MLGGPGKVTYRATITLPEGYSLEVPSSANVQFEFADYEASYSLREGVLIVQRTLGRKRPTSNRAMEPIPTICKGGGCRRVSIYSVGRRCDFNSRNPVHRYPSFTTGGWASTGNRCFGVRADVFENVDQDPYCRNTQKR